MQPTDGHLFPAPQKIHDKVMSLEYQDAVTEIYSVDSQYSLNDGVIVQVTGSLRCTVSLLLSAWCQMVQNVRMKHTLHVLQ